MMCRSDEEELSLLQGLRENESACFFLLTSYKIKLNNLLLL